MNKQQILKITAVVLVAIIPFSLGAVVGYYALERYKNVRRNKDAKKQEQQ